MLSVNSGHEMNMSRDRNYTLRTFDIGSTIV